MLRVSDLSVFYGEMAAVSEVNLNVEEGEIVSILGPNGAGKSTLLRAIVSQRDVRNGTITLRDKDITDAKTSEIIESGVVLVPEGKEIFPRFTVEENILVAGQFLSESEIEERLDYVYEMFPILEERAQQKAASLSGGQQQMLAMGRGLLPDPDLYLLDEPSLGLAPQLVNLVMETLERIKREENITTLLVEQNIIKALEISDRGYVMKTGKITMSDDAETLLESDKVKDEFLGG